MPSFPIHFGPPNKNKKDPQDDGRNSSTSTSTSMTLATTDRLRQVLEEHSTQTSSRGAGHFCRISNQEHHSSNHSCCSSLRPLSFLSSSSAGVAGNNNNNNKAFILDTLERVLHIIDDTDFVQQDGGPLVGDEDDDWLGQ
jgi:hypothetical protein